MFASFFGFSTSFEPQLETACAMAGRFVKHRSSDSRCYGNDGGGGAVVRGAPIPLGGGAWPPRAAGGGAC